MIARLGHSTRVRVTRRCVGTLSVVVAMVIPLLGAAAVPAVGASTDDACATIRSLASLSTLRSTSLYSLQTAASALRSSDEREAAQTGDRLARAIKGGDATRIRRALDTAATRCPRSTSASATTTTVPPVAAQHVDGTGDGEVDLPLPQGQVAVVHFVARGDAPAVLVAMDATGTIRERLVDAFGPYDGVRPLNFEIGSTPARLAVHHAGSWSIDVDPLESIPLLETGVERTGSGDAVLATNGTAATATFDASHATGRFRVEGNGILNLVLVDEPTPYQGTVILPAEARWVLEVRAQGPWSVTLS